MVAYLAHLQYWQRPEYARFVAYPAALAALALLQAPEFRAAMASPDTTEHVWRQQFYTWQHAGRHLWAAQAEGAWAGLPDSSEPAPAAEAAPDTEPSRGVEPAGDVAAVAAT